MPACCCQTSCRIFIPGSRIVDKEGEDMQQKQQERLKRIQGVDLTERRGSLR